MFTLLALTPLAIKIIQFFVALSILILLHEWGHFYAARLTKTRVEKFYLFFDFLFPMSNVLPFALFKKKVGDTEYGLGWFPMGGYVKIAGMVDESMDKEQMALPPKPDEFRSKTAPQRLLIMLGGIIMNIVLAIFIYAIIFGVYGEKYIATKDLKYGIAVDSLGKAAGFMDGDIITKVGNKDIAKVQQALKEVLTQEGKGIEVVRNGEKVKFDLPLGTIKEMVKTKTQLFGIRVPISVDTVIKVNLVAGELKENDKIIAVNNVPVNYMHELKNELKKTQINIQKPYSGLIGLIRKMRGKKELKTVKIFDTNYVQTLTILRDTAKITTQLKLKEDGTIGFSQKMNDTFFKFTTKKYNVFQAIGKGFTNTGQKLVEYVQQFGMLFSSKELSASDGLGGFGSFVSIFPDVFDMEAFLQLLAFISIILAFMNLLPIPGLDGGYVMFLLWEMITGRKVSEKVMEKATGVGLMLLLALMLYANGLDVWRAIK